MVLLSRIFGMIRDIFIALFFGANTSTDIFFVGFKIPNLLRRLFVEGSFSQAFVPILSNAYATKSKEEVQSIIDHISGRLLLILVIVTIIALIFAPLLILIFAYGFYGTEKFTTSVEILRITFPYLIFISLTGLAGGILNTHQRFIVPAFTPVILNVCMILSMIFFLDYFEKPIFALAWGVFFGGMFQLLMQIPFLYKIGHIPKFKFSYHPILKKMKKRVIPTLYGAGVSQVNVFVDLLLASFLVSGSISWLYYADRLIGLPIALIGYSLATVSITKLSVYHATNNKKDFYKNLNQSLKLAFLFGVPATIGLIILGKPILITIFLYGNFSINDIEQSYACLIFYAIGIMAFIFIKIISSVFFALGDTKTPIKMSIIGMLSNILLSLLMIKQLQHAGLALATSIAFCINTLGLYVYLVKGNIYRLKSNIIAPVLKITCACIAMIATLFIFDIQIQKWITADYLHRIAYLSLQILSSIGVYFAVLFLLRLKIL